MMMTLRVVMPTPSSWALRCRNGARRCRSAARDDGVQLGEIADLVARGGPAGRRRLGLGFAPGAVKPDRGRAGHVDVDAVARDQGAVRLDAGPPQRLVKDVRPGLAP